MLLHILLATVKLILVVCDKAAIEPTNPHQATYKRQLSYQARPLRHDAKTFRQLRQILQNNYRSHTDQKHRFFPTENQTPFFRRPIILLNSRKDGGGPYPHRFSSGRKIGRNIKSWPSKTLDESHARKDIQSNHVHLKENARKVKLDNNSKNTPNNTKAVKNISSTRKKLDTNKTEPIREALDRSFLYSALTKGKPNSVSPKFIIKQAGPSQEFGWIGHGTYAPLDVPNIFKAAGVDTHWNPEKDAIFETGLIYPALTSRIVIDKVTQNIARTSTIPSVVSENTPTPIKISTISTNKNVPLQFDPIDLYSGESNPVPRFEKSVSPTSQANHVEKANKHKNRTFDSLMDETPAVAPPFEKTVDSPFKEKVPAPVSFVFVQNYLPTTEDDPAPAPKFEAIGTEFVSLGTESPLPIQDYQVQAPKNPILIDDYPAVAPAQDLTHLHWAFAQVSDEDTTSTQKILPITTEKFSSKSPIYFIPFSSPSSSGPSVDLQINPSTEAIAANEIVKDINPDLLVSNDLNQEDSGSHGDHDNVVDAFSLPVFGLSLPAVATKLVADIFESRPSLQAAAATTSKPGNSFPEPIVDFSNINIFKNLEKSIPTFINIGKEESSDIDGTTFIDIGEEEFNNIEETVDNDVEEEDIFLVFSEDVADSKDESSTLQRVIQDNINLFSKDEKIRYSAVDPEKELIGPQKFSIVEEREERQPIFFEIPIEHVASSTEKELPAEIRTIFVSPENAVNIPDRYNFNLGSSKYKQADYNKIPFIQPSAEKSIYDSPISSYDAPIAPSRQEDSYGDFFAEDSRDAFASPAGEKFLRRIRKTKRKKKGSRNLKPVIKDYKTAEPVRKVFSGIKARIPFGARLGPKTQYTPLTL